MKSIRTGLLLTGPVFFIGLAGLYASRRPAPEDAGPLRVVVDSFKLEPITPREAEMGFDTKAVARYHFRGKARVRAKSKYRSESMGVHNAKLVSSTGKSLRSDPWESRHRFWVTSVGGDEEYSVFLTRLKDWDAREGLHLQGQVVGQQFYEIPGALAPVMIDVRAPLHLKIKQPGQHVTPASISKYCPLQLVKTEWFKDRPVLGTGNISWRVTFKELANSSERHRIRYEGPYVVTADNRKIYELLKVGAQPAEWARKWGAPGEPPPGEHIEVFEFTKRLLKRPDAKFLILKVSLNDSWPLTIKVPVKI